MTEKPISASARTSVRADRSVADSAARARSAATRICRRQNSPRHFTLSRCSLPSVSKLSQYKWYTYIIYIYIYDNCILYMLYFIMLYLKCFVGVLCRCEGIGTINEWLLSTQRTDVHRTIRYDGQPATKRFDTTPSIHSKSKAIKRTNGGKKR